jgi:heme-degrading monooxygenase HmoA
METYSSGMWTIRPGEEDAFVEDWRAFAEWSSQQPGAGTLRLTRDARNPSRFLSFAPWESVERLQAWQNMPEFAERLEKARGHTTEFMASEYELVVVAEGAYQPAASA